MDDRALVGGCHMHAEFERRPHVVHGGLAGLVVDRRILEQHIGAGLADQIEGVRHLAGAERPRDCPAFKASTLPKDPSLSG